MLLRPLSWKYGEHLKGANSRYEGTCFLSNLPEKEVAKELWSWGLEHWGLFSHSKALESKFGCWRYRIFKLANVDPSTWSSNWIHAQRKW